MYPMRSLPSSNLNSTVRTTRVYYHHPSSLSYIYRCLLPLLISLSPSLSIFSESHRRLQFEMRRFVDENIKEEALLFEESGQRPSDELFKKMGAVNLLAMRLGPGKHLQGTPLSLSSSLPFFLFIPFLPPLFSFLSFFSTILS